jgi:hypothetical protein
MFSEWNPTDAPGGQSHKCSRVSEISDAHSHLRQLLRLPGLPHIVSFRSPRPIRFAHEAVITEFHSNCGACPRLVRPMPGAVIIAASRSPDRVFVRSAHHIPIASLHPTAVLRADYDRCLSRSTRMTNASHAMAELLGTEASHFAFPFLLDPYRNDGESVSQLRDRCGKFKSSNSR